MKPDIGQNILQSRIQAQHRRLSGFGHEMINTMRMERIHRQQPLGQQRTLGMLFKERPLHRPPLSHHSDGIRPTRHFVHPDPLRIEFCPEFDLGLHGPGQQGIPVERHPQDGAEAQEAPGTRKSCGKLDKHLGIEELQPSRFVPALEHL
jgi:hypothetical protein